MHIAYSICERFIWVFIAQFRFELTEDSVFI